MKSKTRCMMGNLVVCATSIFRGRFGQGCLLAPGMGKKRHALGLRASNEAGKFTWHSLSFGNSAPSTLCARDMRLHGKTKVDPQAATNPCVACLYRAALSSLSIVMPTHCQMPTPKAQACVTTPC
eukprot:1053989-Amphidinium_carterae.2